MIFLIGIWLIAFLAISSNGWGRGYRGATYKMAAIAATFATAPFLLVYIISYD